ncbi:spore germination protein [Aquibacillus albus]|uniref:Spore germination protein KA n=1 Tax=Aquibacillus albus TaxID=1168171 RepID=A0ABS2MYQ0_9BACI|nr:spore germination protein [Aquibacillus albus]MBM7570795.1 spore germination protein KA [Aquibacillus albus]
MPFLFFKKGNNYKKKQLDNILNNDTSAKIDSSLNKNISKIKEDNGNSSDLVIRQFVIGDKQGTKAALVYIDGLVKEQRIEDYIMENLIFDIRQKETDNSNQNLFNSIKSVLTIGHTTDCSDFTQVYHSIFAGGTALFIDGFNKSIAAGTYGGEKRAVEEPSSETVIRGPRDGFTESITTNTSLIRRRIKSKRLRVEQKQIGKVTNTKVAVLYIDGLAKQKVVDEVYQRLDRIDIDAILESGYIEELIQDDPYTPFPTIYYSERPDSIAAGLLEGRIAIIVDGTPFVLLVPAILTQFMQSAEDYYQRSDIGTMIRILRYTSFMIALLAPSFYIAITTFHQEILPTTLIISLAAQREGTPFPAIVEAFIMEVTFEILREAGVRMPRAVGNAISIVGALVLGEAAVQAGIVSPTMVIIVSITAITNFVIPHFNLAIAIRMLRFGFMFLAGAFGLYGILIGIIAMILHLCSLRSFGVPYLTPFAPLQATGQEDSILRAPVWKQRTRPQLINNPETRQRSDKPADLKPTKPTRK